TPSAGPAGAYGAPAPVAASQRRPGSMRLVAVVAAVAALVGGTAGVGGYALLDDDAVPSAVQVAGGNAPVSARTDGTVAAAAQVISPSTVTIQVQSPGGSGVGTGIIVDRRGHILTNQHVVASAGGSARIQVVLEDGRTATATLVGESAANDLAVIRIEGGEVDPASLTPATFAPSDTVTVGQTVVAVGAPLGLSKTVTSGVVSTLARPVRSGLSGEAVYQAVQTDAAINPGNSGGPLVDLEGRVIGINSSIASTAEQGEQAGSIGIGFAIPSDVASRIADELIADGTADDTTLGVTVGNDGSQGSDGPGAQLRSVTPGSPAEQAGLEAGDVVTAVDDVPTGTADALIAAIRFHAPATTVTITYLRDGREQTTQATLAAS
ncbi:S1C family serine protease, partial [Desertihabitans aurantiacus]|uniref:S1C family serine protease n=1 Tax=Desertihabitans aurantiacus TaxID=2282477 RepID=UPI000DF72F30